MHLSKRSGIYYLWFKDANGKKQKRSTGVTTKTEAVKFLREFNEEEDRRRRALQSISLDAFKDCYVSFSRGIHTPNSVESNASAFRVFAERLGGQTALRSMTPADCEKFLAKKAGEAGPHTVLRLYRTLKAGFTRAVTWGYVIENPWQKVKRPKAPEILPVTFHGLNSRACYHASNLKTSGTLSRWPC